MKTESKNRPQLNCKQFECKRLSLIQGMDDFDVFKGINNIEDVYTALSWAGLQHTQIFRSLSTMLQMTYKNIIKIEEETGGDCD